MEEGPQKKESKESKETLISEDLTKFRLDIFGSTHGIFKRFELCKVNSLDELAQVFENLKFDVEKIHISKPSEPDALTPEERKKLNEILLEFAKRSFTLTKITNSPIFHVTGNDIVEQTSQNKIYAFLERNRQFNVRKLKIAWACPFLAIITSAILSSSLPALLVSLALASPAYWIIHNYLCHKYEGQNPVKLNIPFIFAFSFVTMLCFGSGLAASLTIFFGFGGLLLNYIRDREIKYSIAHYTEYGLKITDDELSSLKNGLAAQKAYTPFTPMYWSLPTWKCPRAYYAAHHSAESVIEEKINQRRIPG